MSDRITLFAILFLVPIFAFAVGYKIESTIESNWRAAVQKQMPDLDIKHLEAMPLLRYCREVEESRELAVCGWYPGVRLMLWGSIIAIAVGVALVFGIRFMGRISRGNRDLLLLLFKPGLYVTILVLVGLMVIHAALFLAAIIFGEISVLGHVFGGIILMMIVGIGTALGVVFLFRGMILMMKKPRTVVIGKPISENQCPSTWKYVKALAAKLDALPPENIVVGLDTTFFVIESDVKCLAGTLKGRTMYLSLPLCRILTNGELTSIVGHEMGHFKGDDTRFSRRFYPIYRGATDAIANLERMRSESAMAIALLPALSVLSYFFDSFATAENEIGRKRELAADQVGVTVSGPQNAASALVKLHAFSDYWQSALQRMRETINIGNPVHNVSTMFANLVVENSSQAILLGLEDQSLPHPMDTHPPLNVRLQAIGVSISEIESAALDTSPQGSAVGMIDDYEKLEKELTKIQQTLMEKAGEVRVNAQKKCPACGQPNPASADACGCGFNFRRYLG